MDKFRFLAALSFTLTWKHSHGNTTTKMQNFISFKHYGQSIKLVFPPPQKRAFCLLSWLGKLNDFWFDILLLPVRFCHLQVAVHIYSFKNDAIFFCLWEEKNNPRRTWVLWSINKDALWAPCIFITFELTTENSRNLSFLKNSSFQSNQDLLKM